MKPINYTLWKVVFYLAMNIFGKGVTCTLLWWHCAANSSFLGLQTLNDAGFWDKEAWYKLET